MQTDLPNSEILVVDDTPANIDLLYKMLSDQGYNVAAAPSGEIALKIVEELNSVQGVKVDMGGYFHTDDAKLEKAMRPSSTLNSIINSLL